MIRYAHLHTSSLVDAVARYLPANYRIVWDARSHASGEGWDYVIAGEDNAGWTLDGYVIPRLGSGFMFAHETDRDTLESQGFDVDDLDARLTTTTEENR